MREGESERDKKVVYIERQAPELGDQTSLSLSVLSIHLSFFLTASSSSSSSSSFLPLFFYSSSFPAFPQDTLNNNSFGKKYSWQEKVSGSSSPLKTGECPPHHPPA